LRYIRVNNIGDNLKPVAIFRDEMYFYRFSDLFNSSDFNIKIYRIPITDRIEYLIY